MNFEVVIVGALETNCYLVYCPETLKCAVIDPGAEAEKIFRLIADKGLNPIVILNTHGHVDHIGANKDVKDKYNIPLSIHSSDNEMLQSVHQFEIGLLLGAKTSPSADNFLEDGDKINIGKSSLRVIHTPGHSPGSVSFLGNGFILSGDTLFNGGVGRTDLPGGSWDTLVSTIKDKILIMPGETAVLPGHGPPTTVGQEKETNPFIT